MSGEILNQELCFQLYVASKEIIRLYKPYLDQLNLTYTGFIALLAVENNMSVRSLGTKLYLDSGTLSPLLKKLEKQGLIERQRDQKDERQVNLYLTKQGETVKKQLPEISKKVYQAVKKLNPAIDYQELQGFLLQLNGAFKEK